MVNQLKKLEKGYDKLYKLAEDDNIFRKSLLKNERFLIDRCNCYPKIPIVLNSIFYTISSEKEFSGTKGKILNIIDTLVEEVKEDKDKLYSEYNYNMQTKSYKSVVNINNNHSVELLSIFIIGMVIIFAVIIPVVHNSSITWLILFSFPLTMLLFLIIDACFPSSKKYDGEDKYEDFWKNINKISKYKITNFDSLFPDIKINTKEYCENKSFNKFIENIDKNNCSVLNQAMANVLKEWKSSYYSRQEVLPLNTMVCLIELEVIKINEQRNSVFVDIANISLNNIGGLLGKCTNSSKKVDTPNISLNNNIGGLFGKYPTAKK